LVNFQNGNVTQQLTSSGHESRHTRTHSLNPSAVVSSLPLVRHRVLIIHQNFPGQFLHIAKHLAQRRDVEVVGLGRETAPGISGFPWYKYKLHRQCRKDAHPYLRQMEDAVLHGQAVARALEQLKKRGFTPDLILAHPGWGETLYVKDIFPKARLIHLCEWYYSTSGADFGFDPEFPPTLDDRLRITTWNALHLLNLQNCDVAIAPTQWQADRHPESFHKKIQKIHEGIDLSQLGPDPEAALTLDAPLGDAARPSVQRIVVKAGDPVVTYVARNLEPYRGFHTFMRALPDVLQAHPDARILIVGGDSRSYGSLPKDAPNWRIKMLRELGARLNGNLDRVHFLGKVPYGIYKQILQVSSVHVYLTYPFVLSWSLLEAMATGCRILASDTAPLREVVRDGVNGELVNFFETESLSNKILSALRDPTQGKGLREAARRTAYGYGIAEGIAAYERLMKLPSLREVPISRVAT